MTTTTTKKTAELAQGTVAYRELGEGEPILFVHGLLVDSRLWDGVAEQLAGELPVPARRLADGLAPRGDGAGGAISRLAARCEVIVAFMDALGLDRATVVGNDTGGAVSQMLTARHPERVQRLVLTNCDTFEHFPPFPFSLMPPIARLPGGTTALAGSVSDRGRGAARPTDCWPRSRSRRRWSRTGSRRRSPTPG